MTSNIEWTDETWNPIVGCSPASDGCLNCYAARLASRGLCEQHKGLTKRTSDGRIVFNGTTRLVESQLMKPLKRKKPTTYFVCSMGDFHHPSVKQEWKDRVMSVVALCPQHDFIFLTKRAKEQREYINDPNTEQRVGGLACKYGSHPSDLYRAVNNWPLPNVYLGTTVENQEQADERIPDLLRTPAAGRFVSYEPALGPVDLVSSLGGTLWMGGQRGCGGRHHGVGTDDCPRELHHHHDARCRKGIDCIIAGGETGPGARPPHPKWFRDTRDQCAEAGVDFFFKGWGDWGFEDQPAEWQETAEYDEKGEPSGSKWHRWPGEEGWLSYRCGKKAAGDLLDGRKHKERLPWRAGATSLEEMRELGPFGKAE